MGRNGRMEKVELEKIIKIGNCLEERFFFFEFDFGFIIGFFCCVLFFLERGS